MEAFILTITLGLLMISFSGVSAENETDTLKKFVEKIKYRISLGETVAKYKWIEGEPILDENREKAVLDSAKTMAENLTFSFQPIDRQFFVDLMEATKLVEYVLVSNWYGTKGDGQTPTESVSLEETRKKISGMQEELIKLLFQLKSLQNSTNCQVQLADAICDTKTDSELLKFALKRAFGNYCTQNIKHKNP